MRTIARLVADGFEEFPEVNRLNGEKNACKMVTATLKKKINMLKKGGGKRQKYIPSNRARCVHIPYARWSLYQAQTHRPCDVS